MPIVCVLLYVVAASTVLGLTALCFYPRPAPESDMQAVFSVVAVARDELVSFRCSRPHLLTVPECVRWMAVRGLERFRGGLLAEAKRKKRAHPGMKLLCHFAVVTKHGYLTSGEAPEA